MTKTPDPSIRRSAQLSWTPTGAALVPSLADIADCNGQTLSAFLSETEQRIIELRRAGNEALEWLDVSSAMLLVYTRLNADWGDTAFF